MSNKIFLTSNITEDAFNKTEGVQKIKNLLVSNNFEVSFLPSTGMIFAKQNPFAVLNIGGMPNKTHIRFLRTCEINGSKYINPVLQSIIADDKYLSSLEMNALGVKVPKILDLHMGYRNSKITELVEKNIGFPCVLKHPQSCLGIGVLLIKSRKELAHVYDLLYTTSMRYMDYENTNNFLIQEFIQTSESKNVRAVVINDNFIGSYKKVNHSDWLVKRTDWTPDQEDPIKTEIYDLPLFIKEQCIKVCKHFNLKYASFDLLFSENNIPEYFCEINTSPGSTEFEKVFPNSITPKLAEILMGEN
jgi:glutathione synthase/RimK-type ligase-like ATP-grasp enzyme